jgi:hypothetical protein
LSAVGCIVGTRCCFAPVYPVIGAKVGHGQAIRAGLGHPLGSCSPVSSPPIRPPVVPCLSVQSCPCSCSCHSSWPPCSCPCSCGPAVYSSYSPVSDDANVWCVSGVPRSGWGGSVSFCYQGGALVTCFRISTSAVVDLSGMQMRVVVPALACEAWGSCVSRARFDGALGGASSRMFFASFSVCFVSTK